MRDIGQRTAEKAKIIYPPPRGVDIIKRNINQSKNSEYYSKMWNPTENKIYNYTKIPDDHN